MSNRKSRFCIAVLVIVLAVVLAFTVVACKKSGTTDKPDTGDNNQNGPVSDDYESEEVSKTEWDKAFAAVYSAKANASNFTGKVSACAEAKGDGARGKETYDITVKIADGKISYKEAFAAGDYSDEYETYYEYVAAESAWYEYSYDDEADGWAKEKSSAYTSSSTIADFGSVANFLEENGLSDYADYTFNSSKGRYEAAVEDKEGATYTVYLKFKDTSLVYAYIEFESDEYSGNYEIFWYDYGATKVTLPTIGEPEAPATYYTVTFDTQGGSAMASVEVEEGAVIGDVTLPTKQCAELVGFAKDANGKETWDLNSDTVTGNITLYAIWEDAHTWGAWKTVSEPTCTAEGMRKRICDKCGDDETESIPALGHDFEEEYTVDAEPDCETKGSESRHCTRCDATTDSREIEALGHNYTVWAYDDTEHWKVCSRCGGISEKTGHVYQESGKCECGATEITPESEFTFNDLGEDTYSLAGYSGTRENIRIPATYNGGTVVSIESSAFANCIGITSVIVPDSVTSIGEGAFAGCSSLESITIPFVGAEAGKTSKDTYQYPLGYIFGTDSYTGGTEVTQYYYGSSIWSTTYSTYYIPASLRSVTVTGGNILYGAFYNCSMITSVTIPDSVTSIVDYAFKGCTGLTSVTIPDSVESIGSSAFADCTGLTSVTIGSSVTSIGSSAFAGCTGLTSVTIGSSVTSIGGYAFEDCTGLTSVYYTGDIAGWCGITFGNRSSTPLYYAGKLYIDGQSVTDLVIPDSVTKIKDYAFSGYTGLTSVNTGNSLNIIGDSAFSGCTGLTSVTIGNSVTSIGDSAFSGCMGLTSVTIGNSVTSIGDYAFNNCTGLTSVTIPDSVTSIGDYAFEDCTGLTSVTIPDSVTSIGDYAFSGCTGLTSVTIGNSVTSIGDYAFRDCTGLKSVYYTGDIAGWCGITFGNLYANPLYYAGKLYIDGQSVTELVIPDTVTEIKYDAFAGYTGLTSVYYTGDIADWCGISFGNEYANPLRYAGDLYIDGQLVTDLVIPDSVTEIKDYAFYGYTGLTSVTIPETLTSIGDYAFWTCYKLVEIYNKSSLSITAGSYDNGYVGYYAKNVYTEESGSRFTDTADGYRFFHDGTDVYFVGYYGDETEITLPSSFVAYDGSTVNTYNIGDYAFYGNTSITSLTITDSVVGIGENAFCQTRSLRNLVIEPGIEALPQGFLYGCSSLESITIPFVGAEAGKTSSDTYQYPFGYIFGTSSYTGGTNVEQNYYGSSTSYMTSTTYYIPASLRSVTVTGGNILYGAFDGCSMLTSVTIGNSVTSIGDYAFYNCTGLTSVTIPDSVTSIGEDAFRDCTGLTSVTIGNSVASIGDYAFWTCYKLVEVYNKSSLDITAGSTSYGYIGCYAKNVYTEKNGSWLTDTADGYRFLYDGAKGYLVSYYGGATDITLPESFTAYDGTTVSTYEIYEYAFYGNTALTSVEMGNSVTSIGDYAFSGCTGLTSVTIGNSVASIVDYAFRDCTGLTAVYYTGDIAGWCGISFGDMYANPLCYAGKLYIDGQLVTDLIIPDSVTEIKSYVFSGCTGLTSVTIGNSVESLGRNAFEDCTGLTSVAIGHSVTSIGYGAFSGCTRLTSVTIGSSVESIGEYAFYNCTGLTAVYYIGDIAGWCGITFENEYANPLYYAGNLYINNQLVTDLIIPDSVTEIKSYVFYNCTGLASVTIPDSVTSIGDYAFYNCTGLTSVTIPDSVTSIGRYAFRDCTGLTSVTIGNSVASIGDYAFYNCTGLTSLTIGNSVASIGDYAFYGCTGLISLIIPAEVTDIGYNAFSGCSAVSFYCEAISQPDGWESSWNPDDRPVVWAHNNITTDADYDYTVHGDMVYLTRYKGSATDIVIPSVIDGKTVAGFGTVYKGNTSITSIVIPDSVTSIGAYAFAGCTGLSSVTIPDSVIIIGDSAFSRCNGLTSVSIGSGVTSIGDSAFEYCSIISVVIPDSVTYIGGYAFQSCDSLAFVTIGSGVTEIEDYAFVNSSRIREIYNRSSINIVAGSSDNGYLGYNALNVYTDENGSWLTHTDDGYTFLYDGEKGYLIGYYGAAAEITLPESFIAYDGTTVDTYEIHRHAFSGNTALTSVIISHSVTAIGSYAFENCTGLTSIIISASVDRISIDVFRGCGSLTIYCEAASKPEGWHSSWNSGNRPVVWAHNNITADADYDYTVHGDVAYLTRYKGSATEVVIPSAIDGKTVTGLGTAFKGNTSVTSVVIPNSVTSIGSSAFSGCLSLNSIYYAGDIAGWCAMISYGNILDNNRMLYIGGQPVEGDLVIPDSVTGIGDYAFSGYTKLTSVTIQNSVTSVGNYAFRNCTGLTSVTIPDSVTRIGLCAFSGCSSLERMTIPFAGAEAGKTSSDSYQYPFGYIFGTDSYIGGTKVDQRYYGSSTSYTTSTTYYIPSSLRSVTVTGVDILYGAFYGCSMLTSVIIGDGAESIGNSAFWSCTGLTSVTIGKSVESIEYDAFYHCYRLVEVYNKSSLDITAGSGSNGDVGYYAKHVYTEENGSWFTDTTDGYRFLYDGAKGYLVSYYGGATDITLPDSFTAYDGTTVNSYEINQYVFYWNTALTSVVIPDSVTSIGYEAFRGCKGLNSVTIPDSVNSIEGGAFRGCTGLTSVTIGNSVASIGDYAFYDCTGLTSVVFEDTEGWQVSRNSDFSSYTSLASADLADASIAATYLKSRYYSYYWRKVAA